MKSPITSSNPSAASGKLVRAHSEMLRIMRQSSLSKLFSIVSAFRRKHAQMPMQQAQILLAVAAHPGITLVELSALTGTTQPSTSRNVSALSDVHRTGAQGLGLVEMRPNGRDRRATNLYLTGEGREMLGDLMCIIGH